MIALHVALATLPTGLSRRERPPRAAAAVRRVLRASARRAAAPADLPTGDWPREPSGAPAPQGGWHASFADTAGAVCGVVAPVRAAVDVEWLERPRWEVARERFRADGDLGRLGSEARDDVLALWTAKEAVLKLAGIGLADLGRVPLVAHGAGVFWIAHRGRAHGVTVQRCGEHLVAVSCEHPARVVLRPLEREEALA